MQPTPTGNPSRPRPSSTVAPATTTSRPPRSKPYANDYVELKSRIRAQGLLEQQPAHYVRAVTLRFAMLALGIALLFVWDNIWLRLLDAVGGGLVFVRLGRGWRLRS